MASERFVDALNAQIGREFAAAHQYVAIGSYYAAETYPRLSAFFYAQADEEREHAMKMVTGACSRTSARSTPRGPPSRTTSRRSGWRSSRSAG
jgi:ferritin